MKNLMKIFFVIFNNYVFPTLPPIKKKNFSE